MEAIVCVRSVVWCSKLFLKDKKPFDKANMKKTIMERTKEKKTKDADERGLMHEYMKPRNGGNCVLEERGTRQ